MRKHTLEYSAPRPCPMCEAGVPLKPAPVTLQVILPDGTKGYLHVTPAFVERLRKQLEGKDA